MKRNCCIQMRNIGGLKIKECENIETQLLNFVLNKYLNFIVCTKLKLNVKYGSEMKFLSNCMKYNLNII